MKSPLAVTPFRSGRLTVNPAWIDLNGHMNQAYYSLLFDHGIGELMRRIGFGPEYVRTHRASTMTVESHVCFLREVFANDVVEVETRILAVDAKRVHIYAEMFHADEGWRSATSEWLTLHIDMNVRRVTPWPDAFRSAFETLVAGSAKLPPPDRSGRRITLPSP
jgi:acyl-CoA thioester hydrolase